MTITAASKPMMRPVLMPPELVSVDGAGAVVAPSVAPGDAEASGAAVSPESAVTGSTLKNDQLPHW